MSSCGGLHSSIDSYFGYKVCINLDRRPDRWMAMQKKLADQGAQTVERFAAVDGWKITVPERFHHLRASDYACTMSHLAVVVRARELGATSVLILEDDAFFDPEFPAKFSQFIAQVPPNWDMLFLGGYHMQYPVAVSGNVVRSVETLTTHAYALSASIYDAFIAINSEPPEIVDRNNTVLQRQFACYCFEPNLVGQEAGYSDITDSEMSAKPLVYPMPIVGRW